VRDYNADGKTDWHDHYEEALTPVQSVSVKLGNISALLPSTEMGISQKSG
jgi:hypothetical protein